MAMAGPEPELHGFARMVGNGVGVSAGDGWGFKHRGLTSLPKSRSTYSFRGAISNQVKNDV